MSAAWFLLHRVAQTLAVVLGATVLLFALTLLIPGNPAEVLLGPRASPAAVAAYARAMGLDRPVGTRLLIFLGHVLRADFGRDVVSGRPIARMVLDVAPFTFGLTAAAMGLAVLIGVPFGCATALRPGGWLDRGVALISVGFIAIPNFVVALLLLLVFSVHLGWLPVLGTADTPSAGQAALRLILPASALALGWVGTIARLLRASLLDALGEPHARTLRAFGVGEGRLVGRFALRLAAAPIVALLGLGVGQLLGGAIFAEVVFARPGLGTLIFDAISDRDYPVVQAAVLAVVLAFALTNIAFETLHGWLDPRIGSDH